MRWVQKMGRVWQKVDRKERRNCRLKEEHEQRQGGEEAHDMDQYFKKR